MLLTVILAILMILGTTTFFIQYVFPRVQRKIHPKPKKIEINVEAVETERKKMIEKKQEELEISAKIKQEKDRERQLEKANEQAKYVVESWKTSGSSVKTSIESHQKSVKIEKKKLVQQIKVEKKKREIILSDEPDIGESNIATIMLRLENGQKFSRRFRAQQTIQELYDFAVVCGQEDNDFKLIINFPKQVLNEKQSTFESAGLLPNASVFVSTL